MKRVRAQLAGLSTAAIVLFALTVAVPRAGLYYHEHAGGEHPHAHVEDDSALAEILAEYAHGHDHDHSHAHSYQHTRSASADSTGLSAALERDDGPSTGHWHQQDQFQRAVVGTLVALAAVATVAATAVFVFAHPPHLATRDLRVRGPPRPA